MVTFDMIIVDFPCEMFNDALSFKEAAQYLEKDPEYDWLRWRYFRASIVFSMISLEAYVNTFISDYLRNIKKRPQEADAFDKKKTFLIPKLKRTIPRVTGKHIDETKSEWNDLKTITEIRNRLVHYKRGTEIYKDDDFYGVNIINAEKGVSMVRGIIKQLNALIGQQYPPWVDRPQSWTIQ